MKIHAQINWLLAVAALVLPSSLGMTLYATSQVEQQMAEISEVEEMIGSATQLRLIAVETGLFHEARAEDQWQRKIIGMRAELDRMRIGTRLEQSHIRRIRDNIELAQKIYPRLIRSRNAPPPALDAQTETMRANLEARTITSLAVITQEVIDTGKELIRINDQQMSAALRAMRVAIGVLILAIAALLVFVWRLISADILRPLRLVEQGTRRIAAGDYGHRLHIGENNEIGSLAGAFDDMSARVERAQAELTVEASNSQRAGVALRESAQYVRTIFDHAMDGIITMDRHGTIQSANRSMEAMFGYLPNELVGRDITQLVPESTQSGAGGDSPQTPRAHIDERIGRRQEALGAHKNGGGFPIELAISQTQHQGQALLVGLVRDISERRRVDKMKAEFVSTVSHELRTPLTAISGALGLVVAGALGEVPPKIGALLDIAHKNAERLGRLIDDLLDMEKIAAGNMSFDLQAQPLMPLIDQIVATTRPYAERLKATCVVVERAEAAMVRVDGNRLQQVLANLLSNAAKYSPEHGEVRIAARIEGKAVRVSVTDRGPGIPVAFHNRIFQKFAQADSSDTRIKGGTGLGLAITKELVERMHGLIGFASEEGAGACFYFYLPLWGSGSPDTGSTLSPITPGATRLLVVEDDADSAAALARLFQGAGHEVDVARGADAALQVLARRSYAAITLDLLLGERGGLALMRQLRDGARTESTPIIVVSAYAAEGRLAVAGELEHIAWAQKPFDAPSLLRTLDDVLAAQAPQCVGR